MGRLGSKGSADRCAANEYETLSAVIAGSAKTQYGHQLIQDIFKFHMDMVSTFPVREVGLGELTIVLCWLVMWKKCGFFARDLIREMHKIDPFAEQYFGAAAIDFNDIENVTSREELLPLLQTYSAKVPRFECVLCGDTGCS